VLLELSRSTFYYQPVGEDAYNQTLMRRIDEEFTKRPFCGVPRMTASLRRMGYEVNPKRVRRLMRVMGLEAIYPKPRLSANGPDHKVYPYLLKGVTVDRPDQAWATDITYIRLPHGFVYLMAVLDWYSRYVISWALSTTLDTGFCLEASRQALRVSKPDIFNTDQGPQFTSVDFTDLSDYFEFYNNERPHETLGYRTPHEVYFGTRAALVSASLGMVAAFRRNTRPESLGIRTSDKTVCSGFTLKWLSAFKQAFDPPSGSL
jgi:putative transposase